MEAISIDRPGFYDHPSYVRAAQSQPDYINTYARYVRDQPYTEGYLAREVCSPALLLGLRLKGFTDMVKESFH